MKIKIEDLDVGDVILWEWEQTITFFISYVFKIGTSAHVVDIEEKDFIVTPFELHAEHLKESMMVMPTELLKYYECEDMSIEEIKYQFVEYFI